MPGASGEGASVPTRGESPEEVTERGIPDLLARMSEGREHRNELVHLERIPAREARTGALSAPLHPMVEEALKARGVDALYTHQVETVERVRGGESVVVVSGTASGKSLCYMIPVVETSLEDGLATTLMLFPTKALAQDQLRSFAAFTSSMGGGAGIAAGAYDGDTAPSSRRTLRASASVILSNPDMLHQGILPYHARWSRFFSNLKYVVVDEIHTYRGVFGSHVANVLRRLRRVCRHYGSSPRFICCSATIRNPRELAESLTGRKVVLVDSDGSPQAPKSFAFWNPSYIDSSRSQRRSSNVEGMGFLVELIRRGVQTIVFTKARVTAELIYRYSRDNLLKVAPALADRIAPYRGGYLPRERREIERKLFSEELLGVVSTNALELGIDVGGLGACLMIGFPPTIASTWQQAGRAGRRGEEALVVVIAYNDPNDQYLMRHPEYFFGKSPESAVIDPDNPYILAGQLACAARELPIGPADSEFFPSALSENVMALLEDENKAKRIGSEYYWACGDFPAAQVGLRTMSDETYTIFDSGSEKRIIGTVDGISALELIYPEAVYLHEGETYFVKNLDLEMKAATVEAADVDYYTQPVLDSGIVVHAETDRKSWRRETACAGDAEVSWQTVAFKKVRFYTLENVGYKKLDLPRLKIDTKAMWLIPSQETAGVLRSAGMNPIEGLAGVRNLLITVLPVHCMCDKTDVGGVIDSSNTGSPALFVYDRYPGGMGFSERAYSNLDEVLGACLDLVSECDCAQGCPSCVGLPVLIPPQQQDPDVGYGWPIPDKSAALLLLREMLGRSGDKLPPKG
jgi:DEAD/DEAH box helicase domain-containing protein